MIINEARRFNFGFASNLVLMLWCVCGGFLLHMLESNYLTMLLKPTYGKPVDSKQDIIDRGLNLIMEWCMDDVFNASANMLCADVRILL